MKPPVVLFLGLFVAVNARAEVFHSRESALRLAFPGADRVEKREIFLDADDAAEVERLARSPLGSRLVTGYVGWKGAAVTGYAFIETHPVRSLPETIMIVVAPDGRVAGVHVLAFHEPPEYGPPPAWLRQFEGRALNDEMSLRGDIAGITGATLTAHSITAAVRRTLAVHQVGIATPASRSDSSGAAAGSHR
ncbi:MAG TPA: FMN-binding protein [Candidatus Krumholzibacteria bacterium]|nr:FMN-binding protein [Candidatus Krumholzibacteria bacterium]